MALTQAQQSFAALKAAFSSGDFVKAKSLLTQLKILMTEFPSQRVGGVAEPTAEEASLIRECGSSTIRPVFRAQSSHARVCDAPTLERYPSCLWTAGQILELAVLLSIRAGDMKAFERNVAQLKPFLGSLSSQSPEADSRRHVLGLLLIHLLTEARLSEFHSEVELLGPGDRETAPIAFPLKLETFLMEGSYNKILAARSAQPSEYFTPFMGRLSDTVREQIADCAAASYGSLSIPAAQKLMMFDSTAELGAYLQQHRPDWSVQGNTIHFAAAGEASSSSSSSHATPSSKRGDVDPQALIHNALQYAIEIERIV